MSYEAEVLSLGNFISYSQNYMYVFLFHVFSSIIFIFTKRIEKENCINKFTAKVNCFMMIVSHLMNRVHEYPNH